MNVIDALILGIAQGLTEFIPVSSSGHLVVLHNWLGVNEASLVFDVALHLGTLTALILFFRKDLLKLAASLIKRDKNTKLAVSLIIATIPAVIAGVLLQESAETSFRSPVIVAIMLIVVAVFMLLAEKTSQKNSRKTSLNNVSKKQAVLVGMSQAAALVPGVSRSGATITTGLFAGVDREDATRFSFLLGIPIMFGAVIKVFSDSSNLSSLKDEKLFFVVGMLSAFISGLFAIKFMLKFLAKHKLNVFAYYRIIFALLIILVAVLS